jgi:hypothetical protein
LAVGWPLWGATEEKMTNKCQKHIKKKDLYTKSYCTHTLCTVQPCQLDRVLQVPGKFLRLISRGLSNKVHNLHVYTFSGPWEAESWCHRSKAHN